MASVLTVQALFFADGGLLALGCNIFNLGVLPGVRRLPVVFKPIVGDDWTTGRVVDGEHRRRARSALQLGALGVVLETRSVGRQRAAVRARSSR